MCVLINSKTDNLLQRGGTLAEILFTAIAKYPERNAFANDEAVVTYRQLGAQVSRIAQFFDHLGLKPGDTVAQLGVNRYEVYAVIVAVYMRGLRSVTLHAMGSEADHAYVLNDSGARVVIADEYHSARVEALRARCSGVEHWISMGKVPGCLEFNAVIAEFKEQPLKAYGDSETVIRLAYTGGTTGQPKGVMLTNRALVTNALLDLSTKDWPKNAKFLCVAPISHGSGSMVAPTLMQGGCVTLVRGFSVDGVINAINQYGCNVTWMVPTMLYGLLDSGRTDEVDWSQFHSLIYSGAPASPARIREALNLLGPVLVQSYGQTEAPNNILILGREDHVVGGDEALASAGRPYPSIRVALLNEKNEEVTDGERGEICVRGPLVMSGYLNKPEETAAAFAGEWLHTGDVAYKADNGFYYIVDRKKDMIISGGFNVYPKEVEDVICENPNVASAAVIGIPDPKWGEMVVAYVQLKNGCQLSEETVINEVRHAKGAVATPKRVEFVQALPLTALGKVDKKALREKHWAPNARAVN